MTPNLDDYFDAYARDYAYYKGGSWCYEDGCLYRGLIALHEASGHRQWFDHMTRLVDGQVNQHGELRGYTIPEYNIDHILPGRALITLYRADPQPRYRAALDHLLRQLQSHPRTSAGPHWHKLRYPHQIWLDGLYMALPFKVEYADLIGDKALVDEALDEMLTALELTFDASSGLFRHGYDEERLQAWANPQTGLSPAHWARSIGWLAMALADTIDVAPPNEKREALSHWFSSLLVRLEALRTEDGRWLQVIDQPELSGNYAESSATAMFAYAFIKAARLGIKNGDASVGIKALESLAENALKPDSAGRLVLEDICCVAGLGGFEGNYRDGTPAYYVSETLKSDDIKGVAPLMMAYAERLLVRSDVGQEKTRIAS
ncbi:glycoside hydrolase family 88 protein [Agrobacterium sp.]|uniref:glycoside hydrolase family 88/105 protein n=1 Tax=Agrobacterium sp. TaxID=361 RepID=UPI0028A8CD2D|nr:glycoside hydrolase family 88 protein [Agrobacterium sp.]